MKTVATFVKNNSFVVFVVLAYLFSWWLVPPNAGMLPVGPLLAASGAIARLGMDGDGTTLLAVISGAIFIPSLALASGVWSGTSKLFEILYMAIWYIGPLNHAIPGLDYIGTISNGYPGFFIPLSIALIAAAFMGRARQLQH